MTRVAVSTTTLRVTAPEDPPPLRAVPALTSEMSPVLVCVIRWFILCTLTTTPTQSM